MVGISRDVSERHEAAQKLIESEETAITLLNATTAGTVLTDRDGKILAVNEIVTRYRGVTQAEMIGQDSFKFVSETWREGARAVHQRVLTKCKPYHEQRSVGDRWYQININPVLDSAGAVRQLGVYVRDISDVKRREQELRTALRKAQEAELLKSRFLANMSHEIRTPLNHIIGLASVILLQPDMSLDERHGYLNIIKQGGQSMLSLLTAILDMSNIESGNTVPAMVAFDLDPLMEKLKARFAAHAAAKGVGFIYQRGDNLPSRVFCDPVMIEQVLNNLVDNAIKFTQCGSVKVLLDAKERPDTGWDLRFQVHDSGIGISQEHLGKVFESFYQADNSSTREFRGAGLGLAISWELVKLLGGELEVTSSHGEGACFSFTCCTQPAPGSA